MCIRDRFGEMADLIKQNYQCFENLDKAIEWIESQLIAEYGECQKNSEDYSPLADQPLLKGLSNSDLEILQKNVTSTEYESGSKIIQLNEKADGIYFLRSGKVSVMVGDGIYVSGLDAGTCFGELALIAPDATRTANTVSYTHLTLPTKRIV